ncbi:MAG: DUF4177 domain-containing protein [Microscillaceae bacterium]|jgi:hypothetical protein|nr:DUF4177 domain-containing protein [Microscillaceae bacterium]
MKKFEYKILTAIWNDDKSLRTIEQNLNEQGSEGWELINTNYDEFPSNPINGLQVLLILKRESAE